jgi:hypothetical protein
MKKLCLVLFLAVLFLLAMFLLSLALSGCSTITQQATMQQDGTLYHPYHVDALGVVSSSSEVWQVVTVQGMQQWVLSTLYGPQGVVSLQPGQYLLYAGAEYQISGIDRTHCRLSVVIMGSKKGGFSSWQ